MPAYRPLRERFDEKWMPEPNSGCWLWLAQVSPSKWKSGNRGYIQRRHGQPVVASRVAWELYRGPIPRKLHVLHKCDNSYCVNPDHLWLGTHQDNMRDRGEKGRTSRTVGAQNGKSKITEQIVRQIRVSKESNCALGRFFGVGSNAIRNVRIGRTWSHVQ